MDYNIQLYEKLYSKIEKIFAARTPIQEMTGSESLLSVFNPAQYIPTNLNPETKVEDKREISQIFDTAAEFNTTYSPADLQVSTAYKNILDYKLFPLASITPHEQEKLNYAINSYNSLKYKCEEAMYNYFDASDALNEAFISYENDSTRPRPSARLRAQEQAALQKWIVAGKIAQETNIAIIEQYQSSEGAAFWEKLQDKFEYNQKKIANGVEFAPVTLFPSYKNWDKDEGWIRFEFNQKDMDNQKTSISISAASNLSSDYGIVSIEGEGAYVEDKGYTKVEETNLTFKCELKRVTLDRPWMNALLFTSRAWKFSQNAPVSEYSSGGGIAENIKPTGPFVSVPTTYILARNVEITGTFKDAVEEKLRRNMEASAAVGIGPFSISGRVSNGETEEKIKGTIAKNSIRINNIQIIASLSQILPKLPNPDPNLPWIK